MADYLNDIKVDAIQTRLLIGGSSVPQEHQYTPLDGDVAICMYGDRDMEHDENIFRYKKFLENAGKDLAYSDNVTYRVSVTDPGPRVDYFNGKIDLTGQIVIGKNLHSDHPTWCPIATLDDIPSIYIHATVKNEYYDYIYHYHYDYNAPTYTYAYTYTYTSSVVGPIDRYKYNTYLPPTVAGKVKTFNIASSCGGVTYTYDEKGDWPPNAQPADWGNSWTQVVTW